MPHALSLDTPLKPESTGLEIAWRRILGERQSSLHINHRSLIAKACSLGQAVHDSLAMDSHTCMMYNIRVYGLASTTDTRYITADSWSPSRPSIIGITPDSARIFTSAHNYCIFLSCIALYATTARIAYSEPITSHVLGELAGSRRSLLHPASASGGWTSWPPYWKYDVISKILLGQSTRIYLENNPTEYHPDLFWNDEVIGFLKTVAPNQNNKMSIE